MVLPKKSKRSRVKDEEEESFSSERETNSFTDIEEDDYDIEDLSNFDHSTHDETEDTRDDFTVSDSSSESDLGSDSDETASFTSPVSTVSLIKDSAPKSRRRKKGSRQSSTSKKREKTQKNNPSDQNNQNSNLQSFFSTSSPEDDVNTSSIPLITTDVPAEGFLSASNKRYSDDTVSGHYDAKDTQETRKELRGIKQRKKRNRIFTIASILLLLATIAFPVLYLNPAIVSDSESYTYHGGIILGVLVVSSVIQVIIQIIALHRSTLEASMVIIATWLATALATVSLFAYYGSHQSDDMISVPSATGFLGINDDENTACDQYESIDLTCSIDYVSSDEIPRGNIIDQSINSGVFTEPGTEIVLTYSSGPTNAEMPDVNNESLEFVEESLWSLGVNIGDIEYVSDSGLPEERVVNASVDAEGDLVNGQDVDLFLSDGTVVVPDWVGQTRESVEEASEELGVDIVFSTESSEEPANTVLSQSASGDANFNDVVEVVVSAPFESVEIDVPDILGETPEEAQSILAEAGFRNIAILEVETSEVEDPVVTQVSPGVGGTGMSEERVVIVVSIPAEGGE